MRTSQTFIVALTFTVAAGLCMIAASFAVQAVEDASEISVRRALDLGGHDWAEVEADGLRVVLTGTASDEATRFNALTVVGDEVDASRVIDEMEITPTANLRAPRFSAEILRNDSGISIIGLVPSSMDRAALIDQLRGISDRGPVTDLLETADYAVPDGWSEAIEFAATSLSVLPRSKISLGPDLVSVTAIADSPEDKTRIENTLNRVAPSGLRIRLDISAPRPVITPFTLRFLIDEDGARFDACSADTPQARDRIAAAARRAGIPGQNNCVIGLGVPSPKWADAAELSIDALRSLGLGSVTISDADITLIAAEGVAQADFDRIVGELEADLPAVFALHAVLPQPVEADPAGPVEFTATLSPEGLVQLRGRLTDENMRHMVDSYAKAAFGSDVVHTATRIVPNLPPEWPVRVLTGLETLSLLRNGVLTVTPENVTLQGVSHREDASAEAARMLAEKLGEAQGFDLSIIYEEPPEPADKPLDPDVCESRVAEIQSEAKITFEPGSATIAGESLDTMNRIADVLDQCGGIRMEIQGYTDSQGREEMNQQLSQARAQSVLNELRARRVLTSSFTAVGYGENDPIADNKTEEGREANRRINFHLIRPEPIPETQTGLEAVEQQPEAAVEEDAESGQDE
ncbi:OmpA family protein [Ruegeria sp. 2205SS24-7]|uniref:OmpA family protein n=1 Tax=Ruegeria discodermiae TaxID=3064389 RepID=UPI002741B943|nr:OmpA family protein [Ruegeria sp. 2205SS24-7]MDP5217523.1 OmpA family protein [Ruegeria sp. 2205SS24-7]